MKSILHNLRILDFSWVLAGPFTTRILADFGTQVVKVQSPKQIAENDAFERAYFDTWNRNKLGITLDLDKPEGIAIAKRLVGISDAVVENFTPRVMANWGLDYESLKKMKPDIIMLSLSAMGHSGPWRDYTGFGTTVQAFSGMTYLTSYPGKPPTGLGFAYADHVAGLFATLALLGALEYRQRTGEGQFIDVSEVEAMVSLLGDAVLEYEIGGKEIEPVGNGSKTAAPHGVYRCLGEDRWCAISVSRDEEWHGFQKALARLPWVNEERFATLARRLQNSVELDRLIELWTEENTARDVMECLQRHGVAAGVVQNAADLANDPQLKSRGFFQDLPAKTLNDASPIRLSGTPAEYHRPAPTPGRDNDYVYGELLGIEEAEITALKEKGVI